MEALRTIFESLGLRGVRTYIASGNVLFDAGGGDTARLERRIEEALHRALGYEVGTFIRTDAEVARIAARQPFAQAEWRAARTFCVGFVATPLPAAARRSLAALKTGIDDFHVDGREIYWLCRTTQSESTFSNAVFERVIGVRATFRGMSTIQKLSAICSPDSRSRR